jgi:hypothetical protein
VPAFIAEQTGRCRFLQAFSVLLNPPVMAAKALPRYIPNPNALDMNTAIWSRVTVTVGA